jgi:UDP:flavonoid glycosyltransferase YjiC (YdhE family)
MRVLFATTNWKGTYFCMIPLGWALQAAGHEVRVLCAPSQAGSVAKAGLIPVSVLGDIDMMMFERMERYAAAVNSPENFDDTVPLMHPVTIQPVKDLDEYDVEKNMAAWWDETTGQQRRNRDASVDFVRAWHPDLVVHDLMALEGPLAARVAGVPAVLHSPGMFGGLENGLEDTTGSFAQHGVAEWDRAQVEFMIDPTPEEVTTGGGESLRMPVRHGAYNGPGGLEPWMMTRGDRPRVCLLWGNSGPGIYGLHVPGLRYLIDAITSRGAELILTTAPEQAAALGDLPDSVRLLRDFPIQLALATSDAVIHQGSVNPMMAGATLGLPQMMLAFADDQTAMAERYSASGASVWVPGLTSSYDLVDEAVGRLLGDPALREAAERIKVGVATRPPAAALVAPLERLARTGELGAADLPVFGAQPVG